MIFMGHVKEVQTMTDILGQRLKISTLVSSTNSSVEPEYARAIVEGTQPDLLPALDQVCACNLDQIIMGRI